MATAGQNKFNNDMRSKKDVLSHERYVLEKEKKQRLYEEVVDRIKPNIKKS